MSVHTAEDVSFLLSNSLTEPRTKPVPGTHWARTQSQKNKRDEILVAAEVVGQPSAILLVFGISPAWLLQAGV